MNLQRALLWLVLASGPAQARTPWTASQIQGSPESPKPYLSQKVFGKKGFQDVLELSRASGSGKLCAVERTGAIWSFDPKDESASKDLMVNLKVLHPDLDYAYGLAFHPQWRKNGEVYVCYALGQGIEGGTKLCRFNLESMNPLRIEAKSEEVLLTWRSGGHNGANLQFGPDGFLYVSTGDAGPAAPPDQHLTGQDTSDLLSSILRIDIDHRAGDLRYAIPKDNPFVGKPNVRPEIWAFGLRNPWKMSFDAQGRLWCGDVGWELWEMIHLIQRGGNYGWSAMEASQPVKPETSNPLAPIMPPIVAHPHTEAASITGGFVYFGNRLPELQGAYIYGDYETGKIWALWHDGKKITRHEEIADTAEKIVTFGQTDDGEIFYAHWGRPTTVHRLVRNPAVTRPSTFPRQLSKTGLFADTPNHEPQAGVFEFDIAEALWQQGMQAKRYIALPGESSVVTEIQKGNVKVTWPKDSVLARTVSTVGAASRPVETQVLHYDGETWNGYSYRWDAEGKDAELVEPNGKDAKIQGMEHRFHSRAECGRCHTPWAGFALGFQPQQLTRIGIGPAAEAGVALGLVDKTFFETSKDRVVNSRDATSKVGTQMRARSWLHANCAHCHRENGGGSVAIKLNIEKKRMEMEMVGEKPLRGEFGIDDARIIAPGAPWRSVLIARIARGGSGHMPLIGCQEVDREGMQLLWNWITEMDPSKLDKNPLSAGSKMEDAECEKLFATLPQTTDVKPLILQGLTNPARALRSMHEVVGMADSPARREFLDAGLTAKDPNIAALFEPLDPNRHQAPKLGLMPDANAVLRQKGEVAQGRELLAPNGKLATCSACHFIRGVGRDFGPDLSAVGTRLSREQLLDSVLHPSKTIAPGFAAYVVEPQEGGAQSGFMVKQDDKGVVLKLATGQSLSIGRKQIKTLKPLPGSLMPEGLVQSLTLQEAADLLAYLESLK